MVHRDSWHPLDTRLLSGKENPGGKQGLELLPGRERPPGLGNGQEIAKIQLGKNARNTHLQ